MLSVRDLYFPRVPSGGFARKVIRIQLYFYPRVWSRTPLPLILVVGGPLPLILVVAGPLPLILVVAGAGGILLFRVNASDTNFVMVSLPSQRQHCPINGDEYNEILSKLN